MTDRERRRREEYRKAYDALMKFYPFTLDDLDGEEWHDITGYEGLYQESTFGRTKSFKYAAPRILKPRLTEDGYLRICLSKDGKQKNFTVHRLVAVAFIPNVEGKPEINHVDSFKFNCHVSNLEWAEHAENMEHARACGLMESGEKRFSAKLTNAQIDYIRENPDNLTCEQFAEKFGVYGTKISAIQLGKLYKNVGGKIRKPKCSRLNDNIRNQIRTEYIKGTNDFGSTALAKKYGVSHRTILNIVNEK